MVDILSNNDLLVIRMELIRGVMNQQENLLNHVRQSESSLRNECQALKKTAMEVDGARLNEETKLAEAKQRLADSEHGVKSALKRNEELQSRCDELTSKCETERKARLVITILRVVVCLHATGWRLRERLPRTKRPRPAPPLCLVRRLR